MSTIQIKISELRKNMGISQKELADYLGVSFQSVSKWENGVTMPDISLLPTLSEYFHVSVDELLGLKPLAKLAYQRSQTDTYEFWRNKLDYITKNKMLFWNDDYFEFLVKSVWKIDKPVNIVDFGCGYGYLGIKLLPLLPQGSTYTGIDINEHFIESAREHFKQTDYSTEFITCNLYSYSPVKQYDIAICQAVLRHLSQPKEVLKKMIDSVVKDGHVICIEVNREFENVGLFIEGVDYNYLCNTFDYHKLWNTELEKQGRDYAIGLRIPFYMGELGLHSIDVRMNDKVLFINPQTEEYERQLQDFICINDWAKLPEDDEMEAMITQFMNRGMARSEAEAYFKKQQTIREHLDTNRDKASILKALGLLIACGRK